MRDARLRILRPVRLVTEPLVEPQRMRLRMQIDRREATRACRVLDGPHESDADAQPAGLLSDSEPPE